MQPTPVEELSGLEFHTLDETRFPAVRLAREAARAGHGSPAVLNAANEEAVTAFLAGEIPFSGIVRAVERAMDAFPRGWRYSARHPRGRPLGKGVRPGQVR